MRTDINAKIRENHFLQMTGKAAAFIKKDFKISLSYKLQFVFQFLQIFFGIAVVYFIGKMLSASSGSSSLASYDNDYFAFALIGIAINSYLRAGLVTITNDIRQTMDQGALEAMCAAPIGYTSLIIYSSMWQFMFESIRVVFYFAIAIFIFGMKFKNPNWPAALLAMALTVPIFLMLGVISCSVLIVIKRGDPINWLFSSMGSILAGMMFPVSVLPIWMQKIAMCFPLTHSLEAIRQSLIAGADFSQVLPSIYALTISIILLVPITLLINDQCMKYAKKAGAFATH